MARKESFPEVARRLARAGLEDWQIAQQLKVTMSQVVRWTESVRNR